MNSLQKTPKRQNNKFKNTSFTFLLVFLLQYKKPERKLHAETFANLGNKDPTKNNKQFTEQFTEQSLVLKLSFPVVNQHHVVTMLPGPVGMALILGQHKDSQNTSKATDHFLLCPTYFHLASVSNHCLYKLHFPCFSVSLPP